MSDSTELPLVLAGPILRRVEETRVCVWIATSRAARVKGLVFNADCTEQFGQGKTDTLAFGDRKNGQLHIAVVEIKPKIKEFLVFFDLDNATLTPEARKIIADTAAQVKETGAKPINVSGYTDRSGTEQHNARLSVRRAEAVKAELVKLGIQATAIRVEGKGERDPMVPTADGVAEARNRRASIALPTERFPTRTLLSYELILELVGKNGNTLASYRLSNLTSSGGTNVLAYAPYRLPTFFIDLESLNILHGSCRKPHGAGEDALSCADTLLTCTASDLGKRPAALFLTGDQIYADDVHDALIGVASKLGRRLLGFDELLPTLPKAVHLLDPILRRKIAATAFSPLDDAAKNNLLGFCDFAGFYLLTLNDALWPASLTPSSNELQQFRQALPAVRRAFANLATYMIFDDHELTDDWNISKAWEDRARGRSLGKRVIAHALCAYWAFQGWGNQPDAFSDSFQKVIVDYFASHESTGSTFEATLLGLQPWFFVTPTNPPAFFLDCRTRRMANAIRNNAPSALMDDDALQDFHTEASAQTVAGGRLLIIAPTPLFGVPAIEKGQEVGYFNKFEEGDVESWHANRMGYYKLLRVLHEILQENSSGWCVILSGDLHYSFVARANVTVNGETFPFTQFTSSSLKNRILFTSTFDKIKQYLFNNQTLTMSGDEEIGFMKAPKAHRGLDQRIREILSMSPTVVTAEEFVRAGVVAKSDMRVVKRVIAPTDSASGPFLHPRTNLGQLVISASGRASLRLYGKENDAPFATYDLQLDAPL